MTDSFRVLHVCTGNICRSPMAERLTRAGLEQRLGADAARFVVESAGTWGHSGAPMEPYALSTLGTHGVDAQDFRARELVRGAAGKRGLVPPQTPGDDDLADPYQGPEHGFAVCGDLVRSSLQHPLDLIAAAVQS